MPRELPQHWAIFITNHTKTIRLISRLRDGQEFIDLSDKKVALFSKSELERYILEEDRHHQRMIDTGTSQPLITLSSGEQKKALLHHITASKPDVLILDNPFDHLDVEAQKDLKKRLEVLAQDISIVQLTSRKNDLLAFIQQFAFFDEDTLEKIKSLTSFFGSEAKQHIAHHGTIPPPLTPKNTLKEALFSFRKVSVAYDDKTIVRDIEWEVKAGEFWQLKGKNGSGKTTLLTMITGDNPKAYGQDLYIFGHKKGSGESVWDIKSHIGYYTPSMTDKFTGYHSVEYMLLSGFFDSVGLYSTPTERQYRIAKDWLILIGMWAIKDTLFHELSIGQQRLLMVTRAMIKHPYLLILDEPTAGLDDESALLFTALVNKIANESSTAIIFVSHREEAGLKPNFIYELLPTKNGSIGRISHGSKGDL